MEPIIKVDNVSMCFNLSKEKHESLKEYFLAMVQGRLQYDEFYALKDVSLDIMPGDFYGLVGLNGSGKSTLLKTIAGVYKPSKGKVTVRGSIAPLIELGAGFDMDLTARENIYLNGTVLGFSPKYLDEKFDEIVEFSELQNFLDVPLKNYSSGMVARIGFAIATITKPDILIADEVLSVGDFLFQQKCEKRMQELMAGGTTVILVSHSIEQIERMCSKVAWLSHGHLKMNGDTQRSARPTRQRSAARPDMNVRLKRARELAGYAVQLTKDEGLPTVLKRGAGFVKRRCFGKRARYLPAKKVLEAQRAEMAGKTAADCGLPTISILTPLYNTPEKYLREFLDSFVNQTAPNGQLCLADASDAEHADVKRVVEEYQTKNQRIVYKKIENKGIAANTNAAAELAAGEYLALADHDDILAPHAMYTMGKAILQLRAQGEPDGFLYSDEALFSKSIQRPMVAHFKPDYAPDYLLCCNYICHLAVFQKALWDEIGGERPECDGSQDHDLFLRLVEKTGGAAHVPQVLYYWRVHAGSTSGGTDAKPYVAAAAKKALADHLARTGCTGTVEDGLFPSTYRVKWDIVGDPKVSILIPNKDHTDDLEKCLHSIWTKTSWENFEVIVIENNSTDPATFTYYKEARQRYDGLQVVSYPQKGFNFSGINNFGRQYASGDYLLLLNNDVEVRNADWLTELLRQCAHPGGAAICGAELLYPDETLQHAGVVTGLGGYAGHSHKYRKAGGSGYMFRAATVQDFSAVTGACLLVKTSVWDEVGGLDEAFAVAFNDVDFCLRVRDAGYRIAWTPYAQLTHYESKSRGGDEKDPVKARRFAAEQQRLYAVHGKANILHDPYYNPNLTMDREDFSESNDLRGLKEGRITVQWRG